MMSIVLPALGHGSGAASCTRRRRQWRRATCESPTTGSARTLAVSLSGSTRCQSGPQIEYHKGSNHHGTSGSPENNGYCGIGGRRRRSNRNPLQPRRHGDGAGRTHAHADRRYQLSVTPPSSLSPCGPTRGEGRETRIRRDDAEIVITPRLDDTG